MRSQKYGARIVFWLAALCLLASCGGDTNSQAGAITVALADLSSKDIHFAYINLDRSPDRKALMTSQLDAAKVSYERVTAVEGKTQNMQDLVNRGIYDAERFKNKPLGAGEVGVFLSNLEFLEKINKSDDGKLNFILEDDVIIPIDVRNEVATALKTVPADWDLLYLGCNLDVKYAPHKGALVESPYERDPKLLPTCPSDKMQPIANSPWLKMQGHCTAGAYAYTIRHDALNKVLNYLKPIRFPIDESLRQAYGSENKFKAYCLSPNLIRPRFSTASTIR